MITELDPRAPAGKPPRRSLLDGAFSHQTLPGRLLRLPLRLLPDGASVPVLMGPGRGLKWIAGSGPHSCWLGINEPAKRALLARMLTPGAVFYDVGAHVGSYTMLAARAVGADGRVIAFEPVRRNLHFLKQHIALNRFTNITVIEAAVAARTGSAYFQPAPDSLQGCISAEGADRVATVAIDRLIQDGAMPAPSCMKIDVEGTELDVLEGARATLKQNGPSVLLATHSNALARAARDFFAEIDYDVETIDDAWELCAYPGEVKR